MNFWEIFQFAEDPIDLGTLKRKFEPIESAAPSLLRQKRRLFVCDCLERALPIFEKRFPDDDRPRMAQMESRRSVFGIANSTALAKVHADAEAAFAEAVPFAPQEFHGNWPPALIARAAWLASVPDINDLDPAKVCWLILTAINSTSRYAIKECRWQHKRLQWYIEQGPTVLPPGGSR